MISTAIPSRALISQQTPPMAVPAAFYCRDRRSLAIHEAGHAVLCGLLEIPFAEIAIDLAGPHDRTGRPAGHVKLLQTAAEALKERDIAEPCEAARRLRMQGIPVQALEVSALDLATMYVAGAMAELLAFDIPAVGPLPIHDQDFRNASYVLTVAFGDHHALFYCQLRAQAFLSRAWDLVEAISGLLHERGTLSVEELPTLLGTVLKGTSPAGAEASADDCRPTR